MWSPLPPSQQIWTNTGARDVGEEAGMSARKMPGWGVLRSWSSGRGAPGSQWGLPFLFPLQHSNLQVQFAIAEEKLRLSLALQR